MESSPLGELSNFYWYCGSWFILVSQISNVQGPKNIFWCKNGAKHTTSGLGEGVIYWHICRKDYWTGFNWTYLLFFKTTSVQGRKNLHFDAKMVSLSVLVRVALRSDTNSWKSFLQNFKTKFEKIWSQTAKNLHFAAPNFCDAPRLLPVQVLRRRRPTIRRLWQMVFWSCPQNFKPKFEKL